MVWNISRLPENLREIATQIDNSDGIDRLSKDSMGDGKLDDLEMQSLFTYCRSCSPEYQNMSMEEFASGLEYKHKTADWCLDSGACLAEKAGITYNLNPVRTLIGPDNDSDFSKAARIADPGITTLLDNTKMSKKNKNTAMWILNPIGKAISSIFG